jgi:ribosomal protein L39E
MYRSMKVARIIKVFAVLTMLVVVQVVAAQSIKDNPVIPQWVIDRQQYETTYVPPAEVLTVIPQWVIDRQQYETSFVLTSSGDLQPTNAVVSVVSQWVIDRQQYETTYVPSLSGDIQSIGFVFQVPG